MLPTGKPLTFPNEVALDPVSFYWSIERGERDAQRRSCIVVRVMATDPKPDEPVGCDGLERSTAFQMRLVSSPSIHAISGCIG